MTTTQIGRLLQLSHRIALQSLSANSLLRFHHAKLPEVSHSNRLHTSVTYRSFYDPKLFKPQKRSGPHRQLVSIDLECTCDSPVQIYPMEIIEIACVKLDLEKRERSEPFHEYVRPLENPQLTLFCTDLTGILQPMVDKADDISLVVKRLLQWMNKQDLISDDYQETLSDFSFISCGNWDLKFLEPEVRKFYNSLGKETPVFFKQWINVKKPFVQVTHQWPRGLFHMLEILGETPTGNLHSALHDCINLARVVELLKERDCEFFSEKQLPRNTQNLRKVEERNSFANDGGFS